MTRDTFGCRMTVGFVSECIYIYIYCRAHHVSDHGHTFTMRQETKLHLTGDLIASAVSATIVTPAVTIIDRSV